MESERRTGEEFHRFLIDNLFDVVIHAGRGGEIFYISPAIRRYGHEPEDLVGKSTFSLIYPDDLDRFKRLMQGLVAEGGSLPEGPARDWRLLTKSGEGVWVEGRSTTIRRENGRPVEMVVSLREVEARRQARSEMSQLAARYRLLADSSTDIILRYGPQGHIEFASPAIRQFGYDPDLVVGRRFHEFVHPDDLDEVLRRHERLMRGEGDGAEGLQELRALTADGGWVWLEASRSPIIDADGRVTGGVSTLRDITQRRAMEDELRRRQAEAEAAAVAKTEFLANMSHEIRTPLTAIIGFAGLMGTVPDLPPTAAKYASRIATASQTLLAVVNDVLDFSKIEAGQIQLDPAPFDPAAFVNETIELVAGQAAAKGLTLRGEIHGVLPAAVKADSSRVRQVLFNLLGNAIKFTREGGVRVEVRHLAQPGEGMLRIAVTDTGVGIAQAAQDRLFQRFCQVDGSISRRFGGTGLGLAICRNLAELMGGEIGMRSEEGRGSTFWFTVAAPPTEPARDPGFGQGEADRASVPARILIVDDLAVNRELVGIMLATVGHDLNEAASGAEAVEAAMRQTFDLILMDVQMPGMDGLAATRAIRETSELNRSTPIVALSADVMAEQLERFREAGMDDHIAKPISPAELMSKVGWWSARRV